MNANRTKARLLNDELVVGIFSMANSPHTAGVIASAGFDFIYYDMEHTTLDLHDFSLVGFSMGCGEVARYLGKYGSAGVSKAVIRGGIPP